MDEMTKGQRLFRGVGHPSKYIAETYGAIGYDEHGEPKIALRP